MRLDEGICLICGRRVGEDERQSAIGEHVSYSCPRCGRYRVTKLGSLSMEYRDNEHRWSAVELARVSGWLRARTLRGEEVPTFGYAPSRGADKQKGFVYFDDILRTTPKTLDDQMTASLQNLAQFNGEGRGQWLKLNRDTDLSLLYAINIDEADLILTGLQQDDLVKYDRTDSLLLVQITSKGWRSIESVSETPSKQSTLTSNGAKQNQPPSRIWKVEDYYQAKEFYESKGAIFNPALQRGSPAAYHVIAQAQLKSVVEADSQLDFFISYNRHDKAWAEWIAWTLEEAKYKVKIQSWDFRPGANFVLEMHTTAEAANRTIAVLSQNYLASEFAQPEWAAALAKDPTGAARKLIPFRIDNCKPTGILQTIVYVDLVGLPEDDARSAVLGAFADRAKPTVAPSYPGTKPGESSAPEVPGKKAFPGHSETPPVVKTLELVVEIDRKPLSADKRLELVKRLIRVAPQQMNMLIFALNPTPGLIPPMPAPQADRSVALLSWAEGSGGCGLHTVVAFLDQIEGAQ